MSYYRVPLDCPECKIPLAIHTVGISREWTMAVNYQCPTCKREGGTEFELAELVQFCVDNDGPNPTQ